METNSQLPAIFNRYFEHSFEQGKQTKKGGAFDRKYIQTFSFISDLGLTRNTWNIFSKDELLVLLNQKSYLFGLKILRNDFQSKQTRNQNIYSLIIPQKQIELHDHKIL